MLREESIINVLNCPCTIFDKEYYQRIIHEGLVKRRNIITIAINLRKIVIYNNNPKFRILFKQIYILPVPDGIGATIPMRLFNKKKTEKIDFPAFMFDFCNKKNVRCYFLGATESNNKKAVEEIKKTYPGIKISGRHPGYYINEDKLLDYWLKSGTQVVFIAMGSPKQELLSAKLAKKSQGIIFVGVGGRFDVLAGVKKRAPKLFISLGLEWFYRFISEPKRIKKQRKELIMYFSLFIKRLVSNPD